MRLAIVGERMFCAAPLDEVDVGVYLFKPCCQVVGRCESCGKAASSPIAFTLVIADLDFD